MSYSCLEELQVDLDLDLHALDKILVLSKAGCKYDDGWFVVTDDGICHLFDKDGNLDDTKKITRLEEKHIRNDITKIIIPNSVISIGDWAFSSYYDLLTNVRIGKGMNGIGASAFYGCSKLTSVIISNSVISIGYNAFYDCRKLTNLTFKGKTLRQVRKMKYYPWGIEDESIIQVE